MRYELYCYEADKHRNIIRERRVVFIVSPTIEIIESEYEDFEKKSKRVKEQVSSKSNLYKQLRMWLFRKEVSPFAFGMWKMVPSEMTQDDKEALQREFILEEL